MIIMSQRRNHLINSNAITDFSITTISPEEYLIYADDMVIAEYSTGSQAVNEFKRLADALDEEGRTFLFRCDDPLEGHKDE